MHTNKLLPLPAAIRAARLGGVFTLLLPGLVLAAPTGASIVAGQAAISTPQANSTVINQTSQNAVINWQQFNVGQNESVQFNQPNASAAILNRVIGGTPSDILGRIGANGRVFLVNPSGVMFGQSAQLNVGSLVASTLNISNQDFMAGHYTLSGNSSAAVSNDGNINAGQGGFVVLAGDYVNNSGIVQAQLGTVALASGSAVTLDMNGDGLINLSVDQAALSSRAGTANLGTLAAQGGTVIMTANVAQSLASTAVNNSGTVNARSIEEHDGDIYLTAQGGDITNSGTLDASGGATQAGGKISVRGDGDILLTANSTIDASGTSGGTLYAVAGQRLTLTQDASTRVDNTSSAGKGGFAELSGHNVHIRNAVDLGHGGQLLIDPADITIGPNNADVDQPTLGAQLQNNNGYGGDFAIVATNSITVQPLNNGVLDGTNTAGGTGGRLFLGIGSCTSDCFSNDFAPGGISASIIKFDVASDTIKVDGTLTVNAGAGSISVGNLSANAITLAADNDISFGSLTSQETNSSNHPDISVVSTNGNITGGSISASSYSYGPIVTLAADSGSIDLGANAITINGNHNSQVYLSSLSDIQYGNMTVADQGYGGAGTIADIRSGEGSVSGGGTIITSDSGFASLSISASSDITLSAFSAGSPSIAVEGNSTHDEGSATARVELQADGDITLASAIDMAASNGNSTSGNTALNLTGNSIAINGSETGTSDLSPSILANSEGGAVLVNINPTGSTAGSAPALISGDVILGGETGVSLSGDMHVDHLLIINNNGNIDTDDAPLYLHASYVGMHAAAGNIDMSVSNITVGTGTFSGSFNPDDFGGGTTPRSGTLPVTTTPNSPSPNEFGIDPDMITALSNQSNLAPQSNSPNAAFFASGVVTLGDLTMNGDYLFLSSSDTRIGPLTHSGSSPLFANFIPSDLSNDIDLTGVDQLVQSFHEPLTLVYGSSQYTNNIVANPGGSPLNVLPTSTNFIFATTGGTVSGYDALETNGQVATLDDGVLTFRSTSSNPSNPSSPPADDDTVAAGKTATQSVLQSTFGNSSGSHQTLTGGIDEYGNPFADDGTIEQQTNSDITDKSCK